MDTSLPNDPGPAVVPPGWHPDPWGQAPLRWWNGAAWSAELSGLAAPQSVTRVAVDAGEQVKLAEGTAAWLTKLVFAMPLVGFVTILGFGVMFGRFFDFIEDVDTSPGANAEVQLEGFFDDFGAIAGWFAALQTINLLALAVLVLRMVWTYRLVNAAREIGRGGTREPGLACASWIIPIVNLWWPYETMRDLFPVDERPSNRLTTWWVTYLVSIVAIGGAAFAIFLPGGALIAVAVVAAVPSLISALLERKLVIEVTALVRRDVGSS